MEDKSILEIKFNDLGGAEAFKELMGTDMPFESIAAVLKGYYTYKLGVHVNSGNYEDIKELEGILELHNTVQGKIDNI